MRNLIFVGLGAIILGGCASASEGNYANDDPGPYPSNYDQLVKAHLRHSLKDHIAGWTSPLHPRFAPTLGLASNAAAMPRRG